jgi:hypothetical protein
VIHLLEEAVGRPEALSILALRGLGKELWESRDAATHVKLERDSWES